MVWAYFLFFAYFFFFKNTSCSASRFFSKKKGIGFIPTKVGITCIKANEVSHSTTANVVSHAKTC